MDLKTAAKAFLRTIWVLINNIYCISSYLLMMIILRPLKRFETTIQLYWDIEGVLYRWLLVLVSEWAWSAGYTVAEAGDDLSDIWSDNALVLCNHQSTADVPTLFYSLTNKGNVPNNLYWIMDSLFKYTNFGMVSQSHGDFFIVQGKETRHLQLRLLEEHLRKVYIPRKRHWICLFPEGGFLRKRRAASQRFAVKNDYPVLEHVTLPRIGAMETILNTLNPVAEKNGQSNLASNGLNSHQSSEGSSSKLKWVIDITIGYPNRKALDLLQLILGIRPPCKTVLHFRKYPIEDIPRDEDGMLQWMYARYVEKEEMLNQFYSTGEFPVKNESEITKSNGQVTEHAKEVRLSNLYLGILHFMFAALAWFHYRWISLVYSYTIGLVW